MIMVILDYKKRYHRQIIAAAALALKSGKAVAYPTDTSYGLAVDATNIAAIKKLYRIKGRRFNKPVHIIVPSIKYAKKVARWNEAPSKLAKKFWPGALTLVLPLRMKGKGSRMLSVGSGHIGLRLPKNNIALDLSHVLKRPITATSANISGRDDCYSTGEIVKQFRKQEYRPDIIINAGRLAKRKPSTVVKIVGDNLEILRQGPISKTKILKYVRSS